MPCPAYTDVRHATNPARNPLTRAAQGNGVTRARCEQRSHGYRIDRGPNRWGAPRSAQANTAVATLTMSRVAPGRHIGESERMKIERLLQQGIDPIIDTQIRVLLDAAFRNDHDGDSLHDFGSGDYWFVGWNDNVIVAVTVLLTREVTVGPRQVMIAGIGGVATDEPHRGRGYASALVTEAMRFARAELRLPFGLLQCHRELIDFYGSRGWLKINEPVFCLQLDGKLHQSPEHPMVMRLTDDDWPAGAINMNGLPW
jgi:GNAT superfamily N-acetyltransferase